MWSIEKRACDCRLRPFVDAGYGWNTNSANPDNNVLVGIGTGVVFNIEERFSARLDWGVPLVSAGGSREDLQEHGLYFTLDYAHSLF